MQSPHCLMPLKRSEWNQLVRNNEHPEVAIIKDEDRLKIIVRGNDAVNIGRNEKNDVIIFSKYVSRTHCIIYPYKGNFFLKDISSYGTYVTIDNSANKRIYGHSIVEKKEEEDWLLLKKNVEPYELKNNSVIIFGGSVKDAVKLFLIITDK